MAQAWTRGRTPPDGSGGTAPQPPPATPSATRRGAASGSPAAAAVIFGLAESLRDVLLPCAPWAGPPPRRPLGDRPSPVPPRQRTPAMLARATIAARVSAAPPAIREVVVRRRTPLTLPCSPPGGRYRPDPARRVEAGCAVIYSPGRAATVSAAPGWREACPASGGSPGTGLRGPRPRQAQSGPLVSGHQRGMCTIRGDPGHGEARAAGLRRSRVRGAPVPDTSRSRVPKAQHPRRPEPGSSAPAFASLPCSFPRHCHPTVLPCVRRPPPRWRPTAPFPAS